MLIESTTERQGGVGEELPAPAAPTEVHEQPSVPSAVLHAVSSGINQPVCAGIAGQLPSRSVV
jgi:hypothetical protein